MQLEPMRRSDGATPSLDLREHLERLLKHRAVPSISLYLPVDASEHGRVSSRIELKNLLRRAATLLAQSGLDATKLVERWRARLDDAARECTAPGLAAFGGEEPSELIVLAAHVPALVTVEDRFHLKPILAQLDEVDAFNIVVLSRHSVRLIEVGATGARELDLDDELQDALALGPVEGRQRPGLQQHSTGAHGSAPVHHGHDAKAQRRSEVELQRMLRVVDDAISDMIHARSGPIVLFGDGRVLSTFRALATNNARVIAEVMGNADRRSVDELLELARPAFDRFREERQRALLDKLQAFAASGRIRTGVHQVLPAADDGRIDTLLLAEARRVWGHYDPLRRVVDCDGEQTASNEDLLDLAAVRTYRQGGRVVMVDPSVLPDDAASAALLRY